MKELQVPSKIRLLIENKSFTEDNIGMSGNQVVIFEDMVLKIGENFASMKEQVRLLKWLEGKVLAPKVLEYEEENGIYKVKYYSL